MLNDMGKAAETSVLDEEWIRHMRSGYVIPQTELSLSPGDLLEAGRAAADMGYGHVLLYDHIVGVDSERAGWEGLYTNRQEFHEAMMSSAFLAPQLDIEVMPAVVVLAQRETCLFAKQATFLASLSSSQLRVGVGVGWNQVEMEALGNSFEDRGRRFVEQIEVARMLWGQDVVSYMGEFHRLDRVGINPRPKCAVKLWFGGEKMERIGRLADGWIARPSVVDSPEVVEHCKTMRSAAEAAGRDASDLGFEGIIEGGSAQSDWGEALDRLRECDATHVAVSTLNAGYRSLAEHLEAAAQARESIVARVGLQDEASGAAADGEPR